MGALSWRAESASTPPSPCVPTDWVTSSESPRSVSGGRLEVGRASGHCVGARANGHCVGLRRSGRTIRAAVDQHPACPDRPHQKVHFGTKRRVPFGGQCERALAVTRHGAQRDPLRQREACVGEERGKRRPDPAIAIGRVVAPLVRTCVQEQCGPTAAFRRYADKRRQSYPLRELLSNLVYGGGARQIFEILKMGWDMAGSLSAYNTGRQERASCPLRMSTKR